MEPDQKARWDAERVEQTKAAYHAIGHYIVAFSRLVVAMRAMVENFLTGPMAGDDPNEPPRFGQEVDLLLGEAPAQYIANVFFAFCREIGGLDEAEAAVGNALSEAVNKVIEERNDIAHGDWNVWFPGEPPWLSRTRPARKKGPRKFTDYPPDDLERKATAIADLVLLVAAYGQLSLGLWLSWVEYDEPSTKLRVRDVLVKPKGGRVEATGPYAHRVDFSGIY